MAIQRARSLPSLEDLDRPVDGYIRVSRVGDRSGESYISPDVQRKALEAWAAERGVQLVVHEPEENVSGATMDRPVFNRIMRRIRARDSGGIVVYKLDRFARTLVGGLTTLGELTDQRALFASATEPLFDFTTADGRIFLQINLMMAEYFRERTKESWETSLTHAVGRGVHIAPDVPYGYVKGDDKRLVPDARAPFVLRAFERRAGGWAFQRIADWLNDDAPPRSDRRAWTSMSVERMIRRRVYRGDRPLGRAREPTRSPRCSRRGAVAGRPAQGAALLQAAPERRHGPLARHRAMRGMPVSDEPRPQHLWRLSPPVLPLSRPSHQRHLRGASGCPRRRERRAGGLRGGRRVPRSSIAARAPTSKCPILRPSRKRSSSSTTRARTWRRCVAILRRGAGWARCGCRLSSRWWRRSRSPTAGRGAASLTGVSEPFGAHGGRLPVAGPRGASRGVSRDDRLHLRSQRRRPTRTSGHPHRRPARADPLARSGAPRPPGPQQGHRGRPVARVRR